MASIIGVRLMAVKRRNGVVGPENVAMNKENKMPANTMVNHHLHGGNGGRDRVIVYYEAKNREEFLELRDHIRSDGSEIAVLIVIGGVVLVSLFMWWMNK